MLPFLFALLQAVAETPPPLKGRLCVGETKSVLTRGDCRDVQGAAFTIAPSDNERLFLWTSADGAKAQIGTIPAKGTAIDLNAGSRSDVSLIITPDPSRGWPPDAKIDVGTQQRWQWEPSEKLRQIVVPRGVYAVRFEGRHYRPFVVRRLDASKETVTLDPLRLVPLPRIKGKVVDKEKVPVPGAQITFADATVCTVADVQGEFVCELRGRFREVPLAVSSSGFASVEIPVDEDIKRDLDVGAIELSKGRPLIVKVKKPDELMGVKVTLLYDSPQEYEHTRLKTVELAARESEARFEIGEGGKYHLLLSGDGPLERLLVEVEAKGEGPVTQEVQIDPFRVEGTARFGEAPIEGRIEIGGREMAWRETVPIKEGKFEATMWERDYVSGIVHSPALAEVEFVTAPKLGVTDPSHWDVRIANRLISGRIIDAHTKAPLPNVQMHLGAVFDEKGQAQRNVQVRADGSFEILATRPGVYTLQVTSPNHVPSATDVRIAAEDKSKQLDIELNAGIEQVLEIVTPEGTPIANAIVLEGVQRDGFNPQFMAPARGGTFTLRALPDEQRLLYIVPSEGSFAIARVRMPKSSSAAKPIRVVVPPPNSSLRVQTMDADKKLVPAGLLMRYNGEFVPGAIARFVVKGQLGTWPSGEALLSRLPAGTYELWALGSPDQEQQLIASGGSLRAPVRVGLSGGEATAAVAAPPREAVSGR